MLDVVLILHINYIWVCLGLILLVSVVIYEMVCFNCVLFVHFRTHGIVL